MFNALTRIPISEVFIWPTPFLSKKLKASLYWAIYSFFNSIYSLLILFYSMKEKKNITKKIIFFL
jgi:hypothetical protein